MPAHLRFAPLALDELRHLWLTQSDDNVRLVIEEVVLRRIRVERNEKTMREIGSLYKLIRQA